MENEIYLKVSKDTLYEKYNNNEVSQDLIEYLIKNTDKNKETIIKINTNIKEEINYEKLLTDGFIKEYNNILKEYHRNNNLQICYLILGIILLISSALIDNVLIIDEILLISGWVLIWEVVELEIFTDTKENKRRKILKNLLRAKIEISKE